MKAKLGNFFLLVVRVVGVVRVVVRVVVEKKFVVVVGDTHAVFDDDDDQDQNQNQNNHHQKMDETAKLGNFFLLVVRVVGVVRVVVRVVVAKL